MKKIPVSIVFFLACLFAAQISYAEKIKVVVSIYPLRDIVQQVGGDIVETSFMVPPGASPHTFEPTPSDMVKIHNARAFIIIGSGLEFWAEKAIRAAGKRGMRLVILSKGLPLIHEAHFHDTEGALHDKDIADPHIWLDPLLVKEMAKKIADNLSVIDPLHKAHYSERAERFGKELDRLHVEITEGIRSLRTKEYVAFHSAWNYFSKRYGLKVLGVIEESPGKEASPKHIAGIIRDIKHSGAKAVFAEPQFNPRIAEVIAKEAGARVLFLDPIGGPDVKGRDTYTGLMRYNLSILKEAMR